MQALCRPELQPRNGCHEAWILSGLYAGQLQLDARSVGPQALEFVVVAGLRIEDVDDHIAVIEQDPTGEILTLAPQGTPVAGVLQLKLDVCDQRFYMAARCAGGDQEEIGQDDKFGYVEQDEVEALLIGNYLGRVLCGCDGFAVGADGPASPRRSSWAGS